MQKKQMVIFEEMGKSAGSTSIEGAASATPSVAKVDLSPVVSAQA